MCDPQWFTRADGLHLPMYSFLGEPLGEAARRAVALARDAGAFVSIDLASIGPLLGARTSRGAWRSSRRSRPDLIFATAAEAQALLGRHVGDSLLDLAPVVVVKRGPQGATVLARDGEANLRFEVATEHRIATDTTGAGDAFDAGFLVGWFAARAAGRSLPAALQRAAVTGHRAAARQLSTRAPNCRWRRSLSDGVGGWHGRRPAERAPAHAPQRAEAGDRRGQTAAYDPRVIRTSSISTSTRLLLPPSTAAKWMRTVWPAHASTEAATERHTPSTSAGLPVSVMTGWRVPSEVSMLATSRSADVEFAPWASTYRKNSRWPGAVDSLIAGLRTEVRPSRSFAFAEDPAPPPVTNAREPDGTSVSCFGPLDDVAYGFARENLPVVAVSVPSGS